MRRQKKKNNEAARASPPPPPPDPRVDRGHSPPPIKLRRIPAELIAVSSEFPWKKILRRFPVCALFFALCLVGALLVRMAQEYPLWIAPWTFPGYADPVLGLAVDFRQFWRLLTPAFLHFGIAHLAFNLLGLWIFGAPIEGGRGSLRFALLLVVSAVCSHLAQFQATAATNFGGLSGAVYGLVGYLLIWNLGNAHRGLIVHYPLLGLMLVWMLLGFSGLLDLLLGIRMANFAHLGGFLAGVALAFLDRFTDYLSPRFAR